MKNKWKLRLPVSLIAALSVACFLKISWSGLGSTTFDDAYMFLRYAKHWIAGSGFSWNLNEGPVYGVTSVLHLFMVTWARAWTHWPDPVVLTVLSLGMGLISCAALTVLGFITTGNASIKAFWMPLLVVPCLVFGDLFQYHSLTGMETMLSFLCNSVLACLAVAVVRTRGKTVMGFCLLAGYLAFLARPDNGIYAMLFPPLFFYASDRALKRRALFYTAGFILVLCVDALIKKMCFGDFLPLPFYAKSGGFYRGYLGAQNWNALRYLFEFLRETFPYILVIVGFSSKKTMMRTGSVLVPVLLTFAYFMSVNQIMGVAARYYFPSVPFFVLCAWIALDHVPGGGSPAKPAGAFACRLIIVVLLLILNNSASVRTLSVHWWQKTVIGSPRPCSIQTGSGPGSDETPASLGWWPSIEAMDRLLDGFPDQAVIAASEHGFIGSRHPRMTVIDLVGLHDRNIAHHGFSADYVFSRKPDMIWFPHSDYSCAVSEMLAHPDFRTSYIYYPSLFEYGIALRKESPGYPVLLSAVQHELARMVPDRDLNRYRMFW
ncbi:hypothetical protein JW948_14510 [bacterium]|nr:hypothetical protein [bacterium]